MEFTKTKRKDILFFFVLQRESSFSGSFVLIVGIRLRRVQSLSPLKTCSSHCELYRPDAPDSLDHQDYNIHAWSVMPCCVFVFVCHSEEAPGLCVLCVCACLPVVPCMREETHLDIRICVSVCALPPISLRWTARRWWTSETRCCRSPCW